MNMQQYQYSQDWSLKLENIKGLAWHSYDKCNFTTIRSARMISFLLIPEVPRIM